MARRRAPAPLVRAGSEGKLPAELMPGPCIEDWTDPGEPKRVPHGADRGQYRALLARHRWKQAVGTWAAETGNSPLDAIGLARTRTPWSRQYLTDIGRADLAAYYDGTAENPTQGER